MKLTKDVKLSRYLPLPHCAMKMTHYLLSSWKFLVVAVGELNQIKLIKADWWNNKQTGYKKSGMKENPQNKI